MLHRSSLTIAALGLSCSLLAGCAPQPTDEASGLSANAGYIDPTSIPTDSTAAINSIRLSALREGATSLGAQGGLAWRAENIDQHLTQQAAYLDRIFDFNQLLLKQNVLPPVIIESQNNLTLDNSSTLRTANQTYQILTPARFVTAAPNWRTYLWMSFNKPGVPNQSLLPHNRAEAIAWNQYLKQGWEQGISQANAIFSANINRLQRDFLGMILYRKLLKQDMISSPIVSTADLGVTGDSSKMRINDAVMRITQNSGLKLNSQKWNPVITSQQ